MALTFFTDHCVPPRAGEVLSHVGHRAVLLRDVMPHDSSDDAVLARAQELDAVLVSLNGEPADYRGTLLLVEPHRIRTRKQLRALTSDVVTHAAVVGIPPLSGVRLSGSSAGAAFPATWIRGGPQSLPACASSRHSWIASLMFAISSSSVSPSLRVRVDGRMCTGFTFPPHQLLYMSDCLRREKGV